jgi:hypothetical protein
MASSHRSGRKHSASSPYKSWRLCRQYALYVTVWPFEMKMGDLLSGPPPVGKMTFLDAVRKFSGTGGYKRSAAESDQHAPTKELGDEHTFQQYEAEVGYFMEGVLAYVRIGAGRRADFLSQLLQHTRMTEEQKAGNMSSFQGSLAMHSVTHNVHERRLAVVSLPAARRLIT